MRASLGAVMPAHALKPGDPRPATFDSKDLIPKGYVLATHMNAFPVEGNDPHRLTLSSCVSQLPFYRHSHASANTMPEILRPVPAYFKETAIEVVCRNMEDSQDKEPGYSRAESTTTNKKATRSHPYLVRHIPA